MLRYETRTGALLRIDGSVAGAFDREHREVFVDACERGREVTLEVERRSLPTNGLPPGPGLRWTLLNQRATQPPRRYLEMCDATPLSLAPPGAADTAVPIWGHGHLDVAWLWTYADARRKATRTFATAAALLDADPTYVFVQSQPQLYEFVDEEDRPLFAHVAELVRSGRFDADVAAMWVEPDCNVPSGESLLRQMIAAHRYCTDAFGIEPSIAWLPDTFGFARTLPTLLAHAGIGYFATTKMQWNDTTKLPYAQFRWRGPDGAEIVAASIDCMEGGCDPPRVAIARRRSEPLVVGYGDGGSGPTLSQLQAAPAVGHWQRPRAWLAQLDARRAGLPVHDDELYLEYHRGVYTTHHDVKAANADLERRLAHAEELAAWCVAVRAPAEGVARIRTALQQAWRIVLRNQFHDVLPGTSIAAVYADAREEYASAQAMVEAASQSARAMLPRAGRDSRSRNECAPLLRDGAYEFENDFVKARVLPTGTLVDLRAAGGGANAVAQANVLAWYRDRPKRWEAWNIDAGYERSRRAARPGPARIGDDGLEIPFDIAGSKATMRIALPSGDPFLRVDLVVDWQARGRLLRVENWLALQTDTVTYGAPHGTIERDARFDTPERRARFEVPGQRFASARDERGSGWACLTLDTYGWSARTLAHGGLRVGHSLLRSTSWPDPSADRGEQRLSWAFVPSSGWSIGHIERAWERFAGEARVRLFESGDEGVIVVACKPAEDGRGVIVRVRNCEKTGSPLALRCGGRMRSVEPVDALERAVPGDARIEGESIVSDIGAFALRSFRVSFA